MSIVVICGPPCSGKSTLSAKLAPKSGYVLLDIDEIRQAVLPDSVQSESDRNVAYRCMHVAAEKLLESGSHVIVVATYGRHLTRLWLQESIARTGSDLHVVQCRVDPDRAVERLRNRDRAVHAAVDLTEDRVRRQAEAYPEGPGLIVDTSASDIPSSIARIERYLCDGQAVDLRSWVASAS